MFNTAKTATPIHATQGNLIALLEAYQKQDSEAVAMALFLLTVANENNRPFPMVGGDDVKTVTTPFAAQKPTGKPVALSLVNA